MADYQRIKTPFVGISQQELCDMFSYDNGVLLWKSDRARGKVKKGDVAGSKTSKGYWRISIGHKEYPAHKLIFFMFYGNMPKVIDHINGNTLDNRIENLRASCAQTNQFNRKKGSNNTSGCKNVSWNKKSNVWQVHVRYKKKVKCWYIKDFELAELVAQEARLLYHGDFANHG